MRSLDRGVTGCQTIVNLLIIQLGSTVFESVLIIGMLIKVVHSTYTAVTLFIGLSTYFLVT